jgi:hypothetical protein
MGLLTLDDALERLLVDPDYRADFMAGRWERLAVAAEDCIALQTIDRVQLARTAERVRLDLAERQYRGSGGLKKLFAATIAAWDAAHPGVEHDAVFATFVASPAYQTYRELPFAGLGVCLEESFYRFACAEGIGDPAVREGEYLAAIVKAVLLSPDPTFTLPPELRRAPDGWFALSRIGPGTKLYAAARGRYVEGALTPLLAELLTSSEPPAVVAARHRVPDSVRDEVVTRLRELGLMG